MKFTVEEFSLKKKNWKYFRFEEKVLQVKIQLLIIASQLQ